MNTQRILMTSAIGLALSLGACDSAEKGGDKGATKAADAKGADAKGADAKGADAKVADGDTPDADGDTPVADGGEPAADGGEATDDGIDPRVIKASALAKKIEAAPEKTDEILATAGLDRTSFRALMVEVSKGELAEDYRLQMAEDG